jgi:hypothetical protein
MIHNLAFVPEEIFLIGAGGVGSRLASELAFFVRGNFTNLNRTWTTIVDHDHVSSSNLNRQLYFPHEVSNVPKGQVLVNRYKDLYLIKQIPEAINADTISRVFSTEVLAKKVLVICAADNGLVVKQTFEHIIANAENDYLIVFTGANLKNIDLSESVSVNTGAGQAFAYGVVRGTPLFPAPPSETLLDIFALTGYGPSVTGRNCGVDDTSGAQTPLMNQSCATYTMTILNYFFEKGIFIPSIYFTDGVEVVFGDHINLSTLESSDVPQAVVEADEEVDPDELSDEAFEIIRLDMAEVDDDPAVQLLESLL